MDNLIISIFRGFLASILVVIICFVSIVGILVVIIGQSFLLGLANAVYGAASVVPPANLGDTVYLVMFVCLWLYMTYADMQGKLSFSSTSSSEDDDEEEDEPITEKPKTKRKRD